MNEWYIRFLKVFISLVILSDRSCIALASSGSEIKNEHFDLGLNNRYLFLVF